ncbi:phospholipid carrier-dependent glycosyltransferase [Streptacidiphilus sp. N1-10]|uniref:Phospholipid carrier-dependent glycosyltransferase n=1 Tax=Streptacidiphilus jeojiensis TaxID=3229225 RepID=A0ABV6XFT1_9ACTN
MYISAGTASAPGPVDPAQSARTARPGARRSTAANVCFAGTAATVFLWALFQDFFRLGTPQILADEPTYQKAAWSYVHGQDLLSAHGTPAAAVGGVNFQHPPLAKYLFGVAQLLAGRPSITADRAVSALCLILTGLLVAVWIGRATGRWTGLLAGGLVGLLPETASGSAADFGRFGMLDPVAELFAVASVALAWQWSRRTGRSAWLLAAATGAATGCAAGAKENGFLGVLGPCVLLLVLAGAARSGRGLLVRCLQALLAALSCAAVFVALYLPVGRPIARVRYLVDFQTAHSEEGHLIGFAGRVSQHPPWWANLWFAGHSLGPVLTVALLLAVLAAVVLRRDRLTVWCLAALVGPFVFHCFVAKVVLGFYWVMWMPAVFVLAALGMREIVVRARRLGGALPQVLAVCLVLAVPVGATVQESVKVAELRPVGVQVLPSLERSHGLTGPVIAAGIDSGLMSTYLPGTEVITSTSQPLSGARTIIVGAPECRELIDRSVRALVRINLTQGRIRQIHTDSNFTVYQVLAPLTHPTRTQIAAEPPGRLSDHC